MNAPPSPVVPSPAPPSTAVPSCTEAGAGPDTALFLHGLGDFDRSFDDALAAMPAGWRGIACPTLVLATERDRLAPTRTLARMAEAIRGVRYRCLVDAAHVANLENPAAFNAEIGRFLQDISRQEADRN